MKIALIGAGNLATNLGVALKKAGQEICQVYSHTQKAADALAEKLECPGVSSLQEITTSAGLYIVALKDSALREILPRLIPDRRHSLWVHTAGSIPMSLWEEYGLQHYGVFYPMQTFSKTYQADFHEIPIFLEASGKSEMDILHTLAALISDNIREADSEQRKYLHLAAVFICNFTNAMYTAGAHLLEEHGLPFEVMLPLIDETARKVHTLPPAEAQTGPAVRYDTNVIEKHLGLLEGHSRYQELYALVSRIIHNPEQTKQTTT